ncbi:uncharacterized protein TNCV_2730651 [Trichonephila clavipes]|nr:uncharacterized protein TNCV_2730651 [Trichonephila clavipes]
MENVAEILENINNHLKFYKILTKLACAYLKGHLIGRKLDWFEVLGYRVVEDKAMDYAHLKQALTEQSPVVRNRNRQENSSETRGNNIYSVNSRPQREFNRFEGQGVAHNLRFDGRRRGVQSDHRLHDQGSRQGGSRNGAFRENPPDTEHRTIRISSLRVTPVDLPYVPILLNETFITALWDKEEEKYFISDEVYRSFLYRPRQKTNHRVVTAQGAPSCRLGQIELQIRIREFQNTWEFHTLNNMQYQSILGIDCVKESKLTLDFDKKSLIITDDQIKQLPKVEKPAEIDLTDTKLGEGQTQKIKGFI